MTAGAWLEQATVSPLPPRRFKDVLNEGQSAELDDTIERGERQLAGRVAWNVNTTMRGGAGARDQVRNLFLGPRHLRQYVDLFEALLR
jgi:hypothetical protein